MLACLLAGFFCVIVFARLINLGDVLLGQVCCCCIYHCHKPKSKILSSVLLTRSANSAFYFGFVVVVSRIKKKNVIEIVRVYACLLLC